MRETHYAVSCVSQKFPTFYDKDKHNVSFSFLMLWKGLPQFERKISFH